MERTVSGWSLTAIGLVPEDFEAQAERAIAEIPAEWDRVVVSPQFRYEDEMPVEYVGAGWYFVKDDRYVAFVTEQAKLMTNADVRDKLLRRVRHAFEKAAVGRTDDQRR